MLKRVIRGLLGRYQKISLLIARWMAPSKVVAGIRVLDATAIGGGSDAERHIRPAIDLLRSRDPLRFSRLGRTLPEIIVVPISGAEYVFHLQTCFVGEGTLRKGSVEATAMLLVHESTHALLHRRGCPWKPETRKRHEQICLREQLRFARRLNNQAWVERISEELDRIPSRRLEQWGRVEELAAVGMPKWFQRLWVYAQPE